MLIYRQYEKLTAEQQKLLCFLAFIGQDTDQRKIRAYIKGEDFKESKVNNTLRSLYPFFKYYYVYNYQYTLQYQHQLLLLAYMLEKKQQWLEHFEAFYGTLKSKNTTKHLKLLRACLEGKEVGFHSVVLSSELDMLVPLVNDRRFLQLIYYIPGFYFSPFAMSALIYQLNNDIPDPENLIGKLAEQHYPMMQKEECIEMQSVIALYDYIKQGRFDENAANLNTCCGKLLAAFHYSYTGNYDLALSQLNIALRLSNKSKQYSEKGFFHQVINNYLAVITYQLLQSDEGKSKLKSLISKNHFIENTNQKGASLLAYYFLAGLEPDGKKLISLAESAYKANDMVQYWLISLLRFYFGYSSKKSDKCPEMPQIHLLRHELSNWLPLSEEEKEQLCNEYNGTPLISRVRHKARWEILLEELTPRNANDEDAEKEKNTRVAYLVNNNHVELRQQTRKLNGEWGAGKRMSMDSFRRGTDFMDETDRRIADIIPFSYYYDISAKDILPLLVGSDRVYTGRFAPFEPVSIIEEKPYLIIERTSEGFKLDSNLSNNQLTGNVICQQKDDAHYTIIRLTETQRLYYKQLLQLGTFPPEAEEQLKEFLPKVSNVLEIHSELVEGGSTLQQREGQPLLCLQILPSAGTRNTFNVFCHAKPLAESNNVFVPGKGLNPCVAEENGVRYQVKRDIKGERSNLRLINTFLDDNDFNDTFTENAPVEMDAEALLRLLGFAQENKEHCFVEWPKGEQLRLKTTQPSRWNIELKSNNGWFEVEGEVPIDDETVLTAQQFLTLVAQSPRTGFIRLNDSDFIAISDKLRKQLERIESMTVSDRGHMRISTFNASLLSSALDGEIKVMHDKNIDELQEKIRKSMSQKPEVSKKLKAELRDYQTDGYQWMERITGWGAGVCLADDMGLGKTVQTIAFLLSKMKEGPALVAAPASVVPNWRNELKRFSPALNVHILNTADDRQETIKKAKAGDIVITTYGLFVTEEKSLTEKKWNTVCLDEAHVIKNRETKTSSAVMQLQAKYRIILTGTPVQNHLGELWNLFQFINPGLLGSYDHFSRKYIVPIEQQDNKERSRQLRRIIAPFMLRRTKQEVVEELPDKTEINMPVELSDDEMSVYEVIRRRAKKLLENEKSGSVSVNTLAEITKLRQAACDAGLVESTWKGNSSKIKLLTELVENIIGGGNTVLVFSQFTSFLALVKKAFDAIGLPYLYLDGSVSMRKREQLVSQFQHGECPVFIISLKAGGLGLNLTSANYVIHLDPWWNPAIEQQATDRAYRIGQRQNVTVYHLISQHTIEEKILRLHNTKRDLADAMLEGSNQSHKLTAKDLLEMLG